MSETVSRRSALVASAVVVVGGVAGFLYGRHSEASKSPASAGGYGYGSGSGSTGSGGRLISELSKVPRNGGLITGGLVVLRDAGDGVHAFSSTCTHLGCTVNKVSGGRIFCPCHGSVFSAANGAVVQGPANSPLPAVGVRVSDGGIYTT